MASTPRYRGNSTTMTEILDRAQQPSSLEHDGEPVSWHPKLTPYRLMIVVTTVAFGTAKAILTQRQSVEAPITLEWLFGTLLSLLFFMVSSYDSHENVPPCLLWLFKPDCMDPVWSLLWTLFSIERPTYISVERLTPESLYLSRPLITPYRILVCTTVASVGMSKAMLGYYGLSADVTWIDWALGVPLTMILYFLGLYEYNTSGVWHTFFASDQIHVFYSLSNLIVGTLQLSVGVAWTAFSTLYFRDVTYSPKWDMKTQRPADYKPTITTFFEDMADRGLKLIIQEFIIAAIFGGLVVCFIVARQLLLKSGMMRILSWARRRMTRSLAHIFHSVAHRGTWKDSQSSDLSTRQPLRFFVLTYARPIFRIVCHIAIHLVGLVVVGTFTMLAAGFTVTLHGAIRPVAYDIICLTAPYIIPMFLGPFLLLAHAFHAFSISLKHRNNSKLRGQFHPRHVADLYIALSKRMKFFSNVDLAAVTWHAFSREAMFDRRWYLRSQRLVIYTATLLIGMAAQGAATYCMFKYKFLRKHIGNFSMHAAHVHNIDIMATTILSMIFPCLLSLLLNTEYFYLLFWPGRSFSRRYNVIFEWSMVGVTIGMLATILSSTVVVATRSASISGVDAITAQNLTDLYFRPPLKYRSWPQNIAWIVLMWITFGLNIASVVLMRLASSHDRREGSSLIASAIAVGDESSHSSTPPQHVSKDKVSEVTVEEKSILGVA